MRVISPTNSVPSITIVTLPLSRILRTASRDADVCNVSRRSDIAVRTGSLKRTDAVLDPDQKIRFVKKSDKFAILEHRHLGDIGDTHSVKRCQQRIRGTDNDNPAILVATGDKVAQVPIFCSS